MTNHETLEKTRLDASESATPGLLEFIETRPSIKTWLANAEQELQDKIQIPEDDYAVLARVYLKGIKKAARFHSESEWGRLVAEGGSPLDLDLRFGRYVHFHVDMVDARGRGYRLYGLPPLSRPPPEVYWGTCQDWLDVLSSDAAIDMVRIFGRLPCNAGMLETAPGAVVTTVDTTTQTSDGKPMIKTTKVKREQMALF